jgi:murein DD-endopeptidase MepM/ murein hydrolase activator NlpD
MAVRNEANDVLPRSHFFITLARGHTARTFTTRFELAWAVTLIVPLLVLWFLGSTFFLVFHDDLVTTLMLRERDMQYGYEDRIASLRSQLDRETTRQLRAQRSVETKLDELAARQADLQARSSILGRLDDDAARMAGVVGASTAGLDRAADATTVASPAAKGTAAALPGQSVPAKPRPEAAIVPADGTAPRVAELSSPSDRASTLARGLDRIEAAQQDHISVLDNRVRRTMARYRDALNTTGLSEGRLATHFGGASGGPFVPLASADDGTPFARAAVGLQLTLSQAAQLSAAIKHVPFAKPLAGDPEITSPFGARIDPFLGRPALHTGVDLSDDMGTEVRATAPGKVTIAGSVSGYGTMVEIDHGAGLTTRYAHLSETDVSLGQSVRANEVIGRVGATGRATGPHLHYETRIDGEPVDPIRFMAAGQRLLGSGHAL